jgi:hypothetical protein
MATTGRFSQRFAHPLAFPSAGRKLEDIEAVVAVDQIDEVSLVDEDIVAKGKLEALDRLGNVVSHLDGLAGIGDVDDPQASTPKRRPKPLG